MTFNNRNPASITLVMALFTLVACGPLPGQPVNLPRAQSPLVLLGFEGPHGALGWHGLPCSITNDPVSEGAQAMRFVLPKYEAGGNKWPAAILDWNQGQGYAVKDWSHYARLSFDAWTDSSEPVELAIELRDRPGKNGATAKHKLQPGRKNTIELIFSEMTEVGLTNIQEILLWASMPKRSYGVTVDNFRLLPGEKLPLADFDLLYPNYRELVFPDAESLKVSVRLHPEECGFNPSGLRLRLTAAGGNKPASARSVFHTDLATAALAATRLPAGAVELTAAVVNNSTGDTLLAKTWALRKLTPAEASALKVYIDAFNNTIVDGKPFFPLGWFSSPSEQYLDEVADSPFNCLLDYGMNHVPKERMLAYLDRARQKGLKIIYCLNDVYPTATYIKDWEGISGNQPIADAVVQAYKDHPAVLAWYLNDELPRELESRLEEYYHRVGDADPNHPCYIVLCNMPEVKCFPATTDVMGVDPYPIPARPVTLVSEQAEIATSAVNGHKPVWVVPQTFAWYQYSSDNKDRGHVPTAAELKAGRAPTYAESRCMTYLALTHGAKGLIYYCYYDLRVLPQYKEMWGWMKTIAAEVQALSPMLLSPEDLGMVDYAPATEKIHTRLKRYNGHRYLMAVNAESKPCQVTFKPGRKLSGEAQVMFEGRCLRPAKAQLTDDFKPLEVHVYDLGP